MKPSWLTEDEPRMTNVCCDLTNCGHNISGFCQCPVCIHLIYNGDDGVMCSEFEVKAEVAKRKLKDIAENLEPTEKAILKVINIKGFFPCNPDNRIGPIVDGIEHLKKLGYVTPNISDSMYSFIFTDKGRELFECLVSTN